MALIRYNDPFRELEDMQQSLNRLFEDPFSSVPTASQAALTTPVSDVYLDEAEENLVVEAHLPGYSENDIDIDIENGALNIRAEHETKENNEKKGRKYIVRESSSSFYRRIGLPKNIDADKINADFNDGVLKVKIPMKDLPKPKKIALNKGKKKIVGKK